MAERPAIPGYQLLGEIGRGGMGIVDKARQVKLNRIVAVKMILNGPGSSPGEVARFQAKAEAVARLQHPNIFQVHEISMADGRAYLAMAYVDGGNLAQANRGTTIDPLKRRDPREAAALVRTLAEAAQHAHERGVVHRDLKPANILLSGDRDQEPGDRDQESIRTRARDGSNERLRGQPILKKKMYVASSNEDGIVKTSGRLAAILPDCIVFRHEFCSFRTTQSDRADKPGQLLDQPTSEMKESTMADTIPGKLTEAGNAIAETATKVGNKITEKAEQAANWAKEKVHQKQNRVDEAAAKAKHEEEEACVDAKAKGDCGCS